MRGSKEWLSFGVLFSVRIESCSRFFVMWILHILSFKSVIPYLFLTLLSVPCSIVCVHHLSIICLLVLSSSLNEKGRGVPSAPSLTCLTGLSPSRKSPRNTAFVNLERYSCRIGLRGQVLLSFGLHSFAF